MGIEEGLMEIVVCPECGGALRHRAGVGGLECGRCVRVFPLRDGIQVLLADPAGSAPDEGRD